MMSTVHTDPAGLVTHFPLEPSGGRVSPGDPHLHRVAAVDEGTLGREMVNNSHQQQGGGVGMAFDACPRAGRRAMRGGGQRLEWPGKE